MVERLGEHVRHAVRSAAPWARVLPVEPDTPIPEMRALAFREATGEGVAVIEDHVVVPPGWVRAMVDSLAEGHDVVGGSVENAGDRGRSSTGPASSASTATASRPSPPAPPTG